ncbi:hypothetical protein [Nocardia blacklockiae]|uniref:hypothetical protein n=1 Tax=Nocardia blacklockiae TaxID=480036 RepID=UPI0018952186|nr:hypothetical protein [Nocardia blacklockiae]MBF6176129.1 hypothetical protein [Nocardia blacklockiae]
MTAVYSALIAVSGTLLGSILTFVFQQRTADRNALNGFAEQLRRDRLEAFHAFSVAASKFRHAQIERWYLIHENAESSPEQLDEAKRQSYRLRTELKEVLLRVELVALEPRLRELGTAVVDAIRPIHRPATHAEHAALSDEAAGAIRAFVRHAADEVQSAPSISRSRAPRDAKAVRIRA